MEILSLRENETEIFPRCGCFNITVWMTHEDTNETREKKLAENYARKYVLF